MNNELEISATTFQLTHVLWEGKSIKCSFDVGDIVKSPLGIAVITQLNKETGDCKLFLGKNT